MDLLADASLIADSPSAEQGPARKSHVVISSANLEIFKNMLVSGNSIKSIANALGVCVRTAHRWAEKINKDPGVVPKKRGRAKTVEQPIRRELEAIIAADCSLTANGIIERLPENMKKSRATVSRHIKEMKFSRKRLKQVVVAQNSERGISERHVYSLHMANTTDSDLIFIDETGFNLHTCAGYGYAPIGGTPWITVPTQRGRNVSVIAAISVSGLIAYQIVVGAFNTLRMADWCQNSLIPSTSGRCVTFVMDNARFHHAPVISEIVAESRSRIQFLPPYSPQLNPIEQVFASIKARYRAHRPRPTTQDEMKHVIENIMEGLANQPMEAYYTEMRGWLVKAQQRQEFI
jgi:transposase